MKHLRTLVMCVPGVLAFASIASAGSLELTVDASDPKWDSGAPLGPDELPRLYVRLYGAKQGAKKTLLDAKPWAASVRFVRDSVSDGSHCYEGAYAFDRDGDGIPEIEGPHTAEACGSASVTLNLTAPNGIELTP